MSKRNGLGLREVAKPDPQTGETVVLSRAAGAPGGSTNGLMALLLLAAVAGTIILAGYVSQYAADRKVAAATAEITKAADKRQDEREAALQRRLEEATAEIARMANTAKATAAEATTTASNALTVANEAMGKADQARSGLAGLQRDVAKLRDEVATKASEEDVARRFAELSAQVEGKVSRAELVDEVNTAMNAKLAATTADIQRRLTAHQTHLNGLYKAQEERLVELSKRTAPKYR